MARWRPGIVLAALGGIVAVVAGVAVLTGSSSPHHPPGLTPLTTTTVPAQGTIWSGEVESASVSPDVAARYVSAVLGGTWSTALELGEFRAVVHFEEGGADTDVYLRKDFTSEGFARWSVIAAVSDVVTVTDARNDYGLADATVTTTRAGRLTIHVGEPGARDNEPVDVRAGEVVHVHQQVTGSAPTVRAVLRATDGRPALAELLIAPGVPASQPPTDHPDSLLPSSRQRAFDVSADETAREWADATVADLPREVGAFTATGSDRGRCPCTCPAAPARSSCASAGKAPRAGRSSRCAATLCTSTATVPSWPRCCPDPFFVDLTARGPVKSTKNEEGQPDVTLRANSTARSAIRSLS